LSINQKHTVHQNVCSKVHEIKALVGMQIPYNWDACLTV